MRTQRSGRVSGLLLAANAIAIVAMVVALIYFDHKSASQAAATPTPEQLRDLLQNTETGRAIMNDATKQALEKSGTDAAKRTLAHLRLGGSTQPASTQSAANAHSGRRSNEVRATAVSNRSAAARSIRALGSPPDCRFPRSAFCCLQSPDEQQ